MPRNRFALAGIVWTPKLTPPEASAHIRRHRVTSGGSGLALAVQKHVRRPALFSSAHIRRHRRTSGGSGLALAVQSTSDGQPFFHGKETMRTWPPASVKSKDGSGIAPPVASRHGYATLRPFGPASFCRAPAVRRHVRKPDKTPCRQSPGGARVAALAWKETWRAPPQRNTRAPSATLPLRSPRAALSGGHVVAGGACAALAARFGL